MKVWVNVYMHQGLIDRIEVYGLGEDSEDAFKEELGVSSQELHNNHEEYQYENWCDSQIHEIDYFDHDIEESFLEASQLFLLARHGNAAIRGMIPGLLRHTQGLGALVGTKRAVELLLGRID